MDHRVTTTKASESAKSNRKGIKMENEIDNNLDELGMWD